MMAFICGTFMTNNNPHTIQPYNSASLLYSSGAPGGMTGAPGEGNCTMCHSGTINDGSTTSSIVFSGTNNEYDISTTYNITLSIQNGSAKNGFQVVVLDSLLSLNSGTLIVTNATNTQLFTGSRDYITHKTSGTSLTSWSFDWTSPATYVGPITFYYSYNVTNNAGNSSGDQIYLGSYTISPSCILSSSIVGIDATCFGVNNGSAVVTPIGGVAPYTYVWSNGGTTSTATNLSAGQYTVTVIDAFGCSQVLSVTINQPNQLVGTIINSNDVSCNGGSDGTATVNVVGGTLPYLYIWDNGESSSTATALNSGTHSVFVIDAIGCMDTISVTINEPALITSIDHVLECGSYTWIDGVTYTSNNNSASHTLVSSSGCDSIITLDLTIDTVDITITNNSPTLIANAIGASYTWLDCNNNFSPITGATNQSFTASSNGNYAVSVTQNNCTDTSICVSINNVGWENNYLNDIILHPNPSNDQITIQTDGYNGPIQSKIFDLRSNLLGVYNTKSISLQEYAKGIYIVKIFFGDKVKEVKVVKD